MSERNDELIWSCCLVKQMERQCAKASASKRDSISNTHSNMIKIDLSLDSVAMNVEIYFFATQISHLIFKFNHTLAKLRSNSLKEVSVNYAHNNTNIYRGNWMDEDYRMAWDWYRRSSSSAIIKGKSVILYPFLSKYPLSVFFRPLNIRPPFIHQHLLHLIHIATAILLKGS